ncbi:hypothetical protein L6R53_03075 [Myxococcota bacterium]|nr:hypothetical protein [Myxococcota bacterium]
MTQGSLQALLPALEQAASTLVLAPSRSGRRLASLADYCTAGLARWGLPGAQGAEAELAVGGLGRKKNWDVAFEEGGRPRLLISLKSILSNMSGTVPNRIDDLMGEVANVQHQYPEVVIGYVAFLDRNAAPSGGVRADAPRGLNEQHIQRFREAVERLSIRKAPIWGPGLIECAWIIELDTARPQGAWVADPLLAAGEGEDFFRALSQELFSREPRLRTAR